MRRLTPTAGRADARRIQPASAGFTTSTTSRTDAAGDGLLSAAEATEAEKQAALEAAPLDQTAPGGPASPERNAPTPPHAPGVARTSGALLRS